MAKKENPPKEEKSTASLVLGILSIPLAIIPLIGFPIAIAGLIVSIRAYRSAKTYSLAGLICSIIGLVLTVINAALGAYLGASGQLFA